MKQVMEMASSKYKSVLRKKLNSKFDVVVSSLKRENAYLKKTLVEMSRQHSEHNKLVERFLSFEIFRLESCQQQMAKDEKMALPSQQLSKKEEKQTNYSTSDESASSIKVVELQNHLSDALEKNKQWLEYDQQREAYVRAVLARMLWLEKQLNEANQASSQQHNEDHSDENKQISQMRERYEILLQKAKDELELLREQVDMTQQSLTIAQSWCRERESDVEELKMQLQAEKIKRQIAAEGHHCSADEEQQLSDETKDLQRRLDKEMRRSANFELQVNLCQKFMLNRHHADQETIADLKRQIKISSQDLEDERQNCSYLKKQMVRVLKMLQKNKDNVAKDLKDRQDHSPCEAAHPVSLPSRDILTSSPCSSLLNESFLECPNCPAEYPASHYRELMNHLEVCLD